MIITDVYDLNHFSRHLNFAFTPTNWSFQLQIKKSIEKKLPPKDENQIKSCTFLIVTTKLMWKFCYQLLEQLLCNSQLCASPDMILLYC